MKGDTGSLLVPLLPSPDCLEYVSMYYMICKSYAQNQKQLKIKLKGRFSHSKSDTQGELNQITTMDNLYIIDEEGKEHMIKEHKKAEIMKWHFNENLKTTSPNKRGASESLNHWEKRKKTIKQKRKKEKKEKRNKGLKRKKFDS